MRGAIGKRGGCAIWWRVAYSLCERKRDLRVHPFPPHSLPRCSVPASLLVLRVCWFVFVSCARPPGPFFCFYVPESQKKAVRSTEIHAFRPVAPDFSAPSKPLSTKVTNGVVEAACFAFFGIAQCALACFRLFSVSDRLASQIHAPGTVHTTRCLGVGPCPDAECRGHLSQSNFRMSMHRGLCAVWKGRMTEGSWKGTGNALSTQQSASFPGR